MLEAKKENTVVKDATPSKGSKKKVVFGIIGLLVVAAVVIGAVVGTQKPTNGAASNSGSSSGQSTTKEMAFMIPAVNAGSFDGQKTDFISDMAFTAQRTNDDFQISGESVMNIMVSGSVGMFDVIKVKVTADTSDAVDMAISKLVNAASSNGFSKYNIVSAVQDSSTVQAVATSAPTPVPTLPTVPPTTSAPFNSFSALYINCGDMSPYFATNGINWQQDQLFTGGVAWAKGTTGNPLWDSERFFQNLVPNEGYHIPVPNGVFRVNATFVELTATAVAGYRTFSVTAEGTNLSNQYAILDIFVLAGGYNKPFTISKEVTVTDGVLDIGIVKMKQNPIINMLTVEPLHA